MSRGECYVFVLKDCPIANQYRPELRRIVDRYSPRVHFTFVYEDPDLSQGSASTLAHTGISKSVDARIDPRAMLAKKYGASVSPTAVLTNGSKVLYAGRIDDLYPQIGKRRPEPTTHDLRDALDAFLAGRPASRPSAPAVGCRLY